MRHYIGCSGFHYKEWKSVFYPPDLPVKKWFEYYCQRFNTIELNVTFYRFPRLGFLQNWYAISPTRFLFAVKAPRLITHYKQFNDTERMIGDFYRTSREGLRDKLGPVLFQLPARATFNAERLQRIIRQLDPSFLNVIEFRHSTWWTKEVFDTLGEHKICFCSQSYPNLPDDLIYNTSFLYYRFHGVPGLYTSAYEKKWLRKLAENIRMKKQLKAAYLYFNNTATIAAISNALYLKTQFEGKKPQRARAARVD
jgi:uncharacterized protein YecE (DUF72 family)